MAAKVNAAVWSGLVGSGLKAKDMAKVFQLASLAHVIASSRLSPFVASRRT